MRILLVGVLDQGWSTNCSMQRALEKLGHSVIPFNYRTVSASFHGKTEIDLLDKWLDKGASFLRSDRLPFNVNWYYRRKGRKEMNQLLLKTVKEGTFDLILLSKTDTVDYNLISEINKYSPTWYYFMDPMDQAVRINAGAYSSRATWASATFSDVTEYFKKTGANAYWITQGVDSDIFKPKDTPKMYDVVFVGTKTPVRTRYIDALLSAGISVTCFGEGWGNAPVYQEELVDVYRKSRIVLNLCRAGSGFSIRVFQVMGTGAFLLSEYCDDIKHFFKIEEQLDMFANENEMILKARAYLEDDGRREAIARNACILVHQKYSWEVIMEKVVSLSRLD